MYTNPKVTWKPTFLNTRQKDQLAADDGSKGQSGGERGWGRGRFRRRTAQHGDQGAQTEKYL